MAASELPLSVLFLWHQHQPLYKDSVADRYELPWVRLHATKDYYDMVALLDEFPAIKSNFNLVPSLLIQLDDYAQGKAKDKFLELTAKRAADLSPEDRQFILENFFMAHWEHMVDPYPRYRELLDKRGRVLSPDGIARAQTYFKEQDWRDLQTWFNLTWFDPLWKEKDPLINALFQKGKNFSEEEKSRLLQKQQEVCGLVVAKHKELQDRSQIEVSTTPFYHPILPLLCDTDAARLAMPHVLLPSNRFRHSEDAREQVRRAVDDYTTRFGRAPQGMWPAEGSVSEEAIKHFADANIRWIATDEAVLARSDATPSFNREDLYEPYKIMVGEKPLHIFFRDHELSDAIGFVYASWNPEDAANDFIKKLAAIRSRIKDKTKPHIVSVILDGENCWEYYNQDGLPFLRALYKKLSDDSTLACVRASDYLDNLSDVKTITTLWAGSWINSNFAIWIGHPEDNKAWDLLSRTRQFLKDTIASKTGLEMSDIGKKAWEEIYIAEGSDWCWWYGDDHSSANDTMFDYLFRKHLMNVYTLLGEKVPEDLHLPIKRPRTKSTIIAPADFMTIPIMDGKVSNYFEWQSAGVYPTEAGATGTMHKSGNFLKSIYFGFDLENIYLRFDPTRSFTTEEMTGLTIKILLYKPQNQEIVIHFGPQNTLKVSSQDLEYPPGAYNKIGEIVLPLKQLTNPTKQPFELFILVLKDGLEQERWPMDTSITIPYPSSDVFVQNWHI